MGYFTIMGVDPASRNIGIAIFVIDAKDLSIVQIIPIPISLNKYLQIPSCRLSLYNRINNLEQEVSEIIDAFAPMLVAVESGYINPRRPGAVIPLAVSISTIINAAINIDNSIKTIEYPPSTIKKTIGANPIGKKDPVFEALSENSEISELTILEALTEHCVDAIAIAYTALTELRRKGIQCLF